MPEPTNRIEPPGIISYETIDTVIDRLYETLAKMAKGYGVHQDGGIFTNYIITLVDEPLHFIFRLQIF
jgi:hypothetical protein